MRHHRPDEPHKKNAHRPLNSKIWVVSFLCICIFYIYFIFLLSCPLLSLSFTEHANRAYPASPVAIGTVKGSLFLSTHTLEEREREIEREKRERGRGRERERERERERGVSVRILFGQRERQVVPMFLGSACGPEGR